MSDAPAPVFPAAPPEPIDLDVAGGLALVRCDPALTVAAVRAVNESLEHLQPWMAWAAEPATEASLGAFLAAGEEQWHARRDFAYSIVEPATGAVVGGCGLHARLGPAALEIGYWVHVDWIGRGIATAVARALTSAAFTIPGIERVEIHCEEQNHRSARVPEKLGYTFEGLIVPDAGPCEGRSTQVWSIERSVWERGAP